MTETVAAIVAAHRAGSTSPVETAARSFARIRAWNDPAVFISLRDEQEAIAEADALAAKDASALPLFGVPVAVKDNTDVLGLPSTAACPAFSYQPSRDATAVARLRAQEGGVALRAGLARPGLGLGGDIHGLDRARSARPSR